jgi:Zn-dependent protease with chaperone function
VGLPYQIAQILAPSRFSPVLEKSQREITEESIEHSFYNREKLPEGLKDIPKEKLYRLLKRTKEIAKEMGITQEIKIYSSEENLSDSAFGSKVSLTAIPIFISLRTLNCSDEFVDFIIAHELSHIANHDLLHELAISPTIFVIELIACCFFSPFIIPFIESFASIVEDYFQRLHESGADHHAMNTLQSNKGMLEFCNKSIKEHKEIRKNTEHEFYHDQNTYFNKPQLVSRMIRKFFFLVSKETLVSNFSLEGNSRSDLRHPPMTKRREAAMNFRPKDLSINRGLPKEA